MVLRSWSLTLELKVGIGPCRQKVEFRPLCGEVGFYTGVEKLSSDHGVGKLSSDHGVGKLSSDHGVGKLSSDHGVGKLSSNHGVGKLSTDHGVAKLSSDHGVGKLSSDHGVEKLRFDHESLLGIASPRVKEPTSEINKLFVPEQQIQPIVDLPVFAWKCICSTVVIDIIMVVSIQQR